MIETIAILTDKGALSKDLKENTLINVFKLENGKVCEYESITLESTDKKSFSKLLELKRVTLIYIESINHELKHFFGMLGIKIKCKEDWEGDEFINQFVFG
ncbi:MAG: hypothetical protein E6767_10595 [Dysgonomonas sp.]|nr:hypothetical protein [Dysgonomonas sp.]